MFDEPEITLDDTNPNQPVSLDDQLRREEPPITADDTNPSQSIPLEDRLRREEPPFLDEDTNPSLIRRQMSRQRPAHWQRILAALMLAGALALTVAAAVVWMGGEDSTPATLPGASVQQTATPPASEGGEAAVVPYEPSVESGQQPAAPRVDPLLRPTAAADEIAAALLTPVSSQPLSGEIPRKSAPFTLQSKRGRTRVIQYTVQQGDSLDSIAGKFGFSSYWPIVWSNSRSKMSALRPGARLNIVPEDGVYYEITDNITIRELAEKFKVDPYAIIDSEYNNLFGSLPDTLLVAAVGGVMIPGGQGEEINLLPANTNVSSGGGAGAISGSYTLWGCTANIGPGSTPLTRPLGGYQFMQDFTLGGHEGVDLSADVGDPVSAAGGGTVVYAGWNSTGYGNVVVIAHGAYFTLYGHLSAYSVRCGSSVDAGQVIGQVGNTGNSSGPHLHFEVRDANWNALNPRRFVSF